MKPTILFAWYRPPPPFFWGGAEVSHNILAEYLAEHGYKVIYIGTHRSLYNNHLSLLPEIIDATFSDPAIQLCSKTSNEAIDYHYQSIYCHAVEPQQIPILVKHYLTEQCDLLFTAHEHCGQLISLARSCHVKSIGWVHSLSAAGLLAATSGPDILLSNSRYVQAEVQDRLGISSSLFYPPFRSQPPVPSSGEYLGFVNPIPRKGSNLFLRLARCLSTRKFIALEAWYPVDPSNFPSNVLYLARQLDVNPIFSKFRVLLMPSARPEGFGRLPVEVGLLGIPTIATAAGGLTESVGEGGILLDETSISSWIQAIEHLDRPEIYEKYSRLARQNALRFIGDPVVKLTKLGVL